MAFGVEAINVYDLMWYAIYWASKLLTTINYRINQFNIECIEYRNESHSVSSWFESTFDLKIFCNAIVINICLNSKK